MSLSQSQSQPFSISKPLVSSCFLISSQFLMMLMNARNNTSRSVFTASQWQELDNQAQIFKYMVSGIPIPPDLTFYIKRNCLDISSRLFSPPHHQPLGWGCFEMGFGRKPDPEPGRCRRTDGKKWRCSKEAFLDSKYCERHMHRGRNRSRKPVEIATTKQPISISSLMAATENETHHHHNTTTTLHPFLYTHSSSSSRPSSGIDFSPQNSNTHLVLDSGSYSQAHKDYRHFQGLKEEESNMCNDFFMKSFSPDPKKLRQSCSDFQSGGGYSQFQLQSLTDISKDQQKQHHKEQQHCFVLGTDFKSKTNPVMKMEKREEEPKQPLRHFFDEWPLKSRDSSSSSSSWLDLEENRSSNQAYFSNTQLSISIPMSSSNDFNSRNP